MTTDRFYHPGRDGRGRRVEALALPPAASGSTTEQWQPARRSQGGILARTTATAQEMRRALASGVPVAGFASSGVERVVADAGHPVPARDTRLLGAAVITLLTQDDVADNRRTNALARRP